MEITFLVTFRTPQMDKMDMVAPSPDHLRKVVVRPNPQRSSTEGKTVIRAAVVPNNPFIMGNCTHHPWKPEYRKRRIVGMDCHRNAAFFRYRYNGIQKQT